MSSEEGPVVALLGRYRYYFAAAFVLVLAGGILAVLYHGLIVIGAARVSVLEGYDMDNGPWSGLDAWTLGSLAVFVVLQLVFVGTVRATVRRDRPRRSAVAGFSAIATLALAFLSAICAITALELVDRLGWDHVTTVRESHTIAGNGGVFLLVFVGVAWIVWLVVLYVARTRLAWPWVKVVRRAIGVLLAGSWIEFVSALAVDAGMRARAKDDCYCTRGTFMSLFIGIPLMLLAIGPGLYLLFRDYRAHPAAARAAVKAATRVEGA